MFLEGTDKNIRQAEEFGLYSKIHRSHQKFCKQESMIFKFISESLQHRGGLGESIKD